MTDYAVMAAAEWIATLVLVTVTVWAMGRVLVTGFTRYPWPEWARRTK